MKDIKVSELKVGNIFTESLQLKNRISYTVSSIYDEIVVAGNKGLGKLKQFKTDQEKLIILLKES